VTVPVLENDSDPDQDPLKVTLALAPAHGTVTVHDSGSITYTPACGLHSSETFVYRLDDGAGGSDTATVIVTVPDPAQADRPGDDLDAALAVTPPTPVRAKPLFPSGPAPPHPAPAPPKRVSHSFRFVARPDLRCMECEGVMQPFGKCPRVDRSEQEGRGRRAVSTLM
jgi:hypothetical protein